MSELSGSPVHTGVQVMADIRQGSPCSKCGGTERYVTCRNCVTCQRAYSLSRDYKTPKARYFQQRANAYERGIEWEISFEEWWSLWEPHWANRGREKGQLVMARHGDDGPYSLTNVSIKTVEENYYEAKPKRLDSRRRQASAYRLGLSSPSRRPRRTPSHRPLAETA